MCITNTLHPTKKEKNKLVNDCLDCNCELELSNYSKTENPEHIICKMGCECNECDCSYVSGY